MALGDYPCGTGPCGYDPIVTGTPRTFTTPAAIRYDGASRSFVQDSAGLLTACHPVDRLMAIGLLVKRGSLASSPTTGHTLHEITDLGSPNLAREVSDRLTQAQPVARVLAAGDARIDSIEHEIRPHGGIAVAVHYTNLRATQDRARTIRYPG